MKRFLAVCLTLMLLVGLAPMRDARADTTMTVVGGWLRLRAEPNFQATTITSYYTGTVVTVLSTSGGWCYVRTPDNRNGYMYAQYLSGATTTPPAGGSAGVGAATVVSANGYGVKLRTGPSTAYGVIKVCPVGTAVTILAKGTYWDFIRVGNQTGYMMNQFLSTGAAVAPSTSYLARVISQNGYGVRLRSGPGKGYGVLGVYSVGTEVTVLKHNATWDYIRVGSRTGYMMNEFLTTSQVSTVITSATLNNVSPKTGDVLTASVTPANATVTYRWTDANGNVLGTGATYVVSTADTGKRIRVTVTGTGLYSGTATSALSNQVTFRAALTGLALDTYAPYVGQVITATPTPAEATADYWWYRSDGTCVGRGRSYVAQAADVGRGLACKAIGNGSYSGEVYTAYTSPVTATVTPVEQTLQGTVTIQSSGKPGEMATASISLNSNLVDYTWYLDGWVTGGNTGMMTVPNNVGSKLVVRVTAKAGSGFAGYVESAPMTIVSDAPSTTPISGSVTIPSSAKAGDVLSASVSVNTANVTYAWYLNGAAIAGANSSSLNVTADMAGGQVTLQVTAAGADGVTGSLTSNACAVEATPVTPVTPTQLSGSVSIPGSAQVGETITASLSLNSTSVTYAWYLNGGVIAGANGHQLAINDAMAGQNVSVTVTAASADYTGSVSSNSCAVAVPAPAPDPDPEPDPGTTTDI